GRRSSRTPRDVARARRGRPRTCAGCARETRRRVPRMRFRVRPRRARRAGCRRRARPVRARTRSRCRGSRPRPAQPVRRVASGMGSSRRGVLEAAVRLVLPAARAQTRIGLVAEDRPMHLATFRRLVAGVLVGSLVSACSGGGAPAPAESAAANAPPAAPAAAPAAKQKTFLDAQLKAIDKAKAVEQTLEQDKANLDQAIEDSGG